ncbi:NtaA/DmoA family FMN-dependent monooxygenase [Xanthobacter sp. V4C-4]|uniref:NtaA/DmoA family FMN-dependent monooxygenase n=1 Tax=Xanthobacter cornucopiae TaxID=3119924 RepID=UPI00372A210F
MSARSDHLTLVAFADPNMFHQGDPARQQDPDRFRFDRFIAHARLAERAGFDALFKPDFLGFDTLTADVRPRAGFEPLTLLAALSQHTRRVGLIVTESTSFTEPYNIARYFTSLDNITAGRAGWNVVTSYYGEENFGDGRLLPLAERYRQADEFLAVTNRLWSGWKPGAVSHGPDGHRFDGNFITPTDFAGTYFRVKQALDIPPGPQGRPVIVQAGASEEGLAFAARHAELVFAATPDLDAGRAFYRDLKQRAERQGRAAAQVRVLPGLNLFVADTAAAAREIHQSQFTDKNLLKFRDKLMREAPLFTLGELDLDAPVPAGAIPSEEALQQVERRRSRGLLLRHAFTRPGATLRQTLSRIYEFGHLTLIGTPQAVADDMALWFEARAADGFVLKGGNAFAPVVEEVLPILRGKGLLKPVADAPSTFRQAVFGAAA